MFSLPHPYAMLPKASALLLQCLFHVHENMSSIASVIFRSGMMIIVHFCMLQKVNTIFVHFSPFFSDQIDIARR